MGKELSMLEKFNKGIEDSLNNKEPEVEVLQHDYEELLKSGRTFGLFFASWDQETSSFILFDGDVKIVLTAEELARQKIEVGAREKFILMGNKIQVRVVNIDKEKNTVYVSLPDNAGGNALNRYVRGDKEKLHQEITEILKSGDRPKVWGKVIKVKPDKLTVDILDMGILGFISLSHWQYGYTRGFDGLVEEGQYYQFEITGPAHNKEGKNTKAWILSRKRIAKNPYEAADAGSIKVGDLLNVKCTSMPEGKSYWWGTTERVPGVEVMVDYKEQGYSRVEHIFVGIHYICRVKRVEWNDKKGGYNISLIPIRVSSSDLARYNSFARTKRPLSVE